MSSVSYLTGNRRSFGGQVQGQKIGGLLQAEQVHRALLEKVRIPFEQRNVEKRRRRRRRQQRFGFDQKWREAGRLRVDANRQPDADPQEVQT